MESSTPEVSMEVQLQKFFSLLHILMECNRNRRLTSRVLEPENYFVSMMKDAVFDSPMIVDSLTVLSPSEDENEIFNVPMEHVEDTLPEFHPPRKGLSAIRTFPPGCGRGAPSVRDEKPLAEVEKKSSVETFSPITGRTEFEECDVLEDFPTESEVCGVLEDPLGMTSRLEDGSMEGKFSKGEANVAHFGSSPETKFAPSPSGFKKKKGGKGKPLAPRKGKGKTKMANQGKCFHCNVDGHWKRNCPKYLAKKKEKKADFDGLATR